MKEEHDLSASPASPASSHSSSMFPAANAPTPPHSQGLAFNPQTIDIDMPDTTAQSIMLATGDIAAPNDVTMTDEGETGEEEKDMTFLHSLSNPMRNTAPKARKGLESFEHEEDENAPGYCWKNRRAMDDLIKSEDQLLDKDFSLLSKLVVLCGGFIPDSAIEEFGDPWLERIKANDPNFKPFHFPNLPPYASQKWS